MIKSQKTKLTKLWGQVIHAIYKERCALCGTKGTAMHAHHIYSRRRLTTRFDIDNGILLCYACHKGSSLISAHEAPEAFFDWLKKTRGEDWLKALRRKSEQTAKECPINYEKTKRELEEKLQRLL